MQDVIRHRTAFEERVIYPRTGRVVIRQFDDAWGIVPSDIVIVAEGNQGTVPPIDPIDGDYTPIAPTKGPKQPTTLCA
jgi:hypothetical protein